MGPYPLSVSVSVNDTEETAPIRIIIVQGDWAQWARTARLILTEKEKLMKLKRERKRKKKK